MNYNILDTIWRTGLNTIGVVAIKTNTGWKAYMGVADGFSEKEDKYKIASSGTKLRKAEAIAFFPKLDPKKCEND